MSELITEKANLFVKKGDSLFNNKNAKFSIFFYKRAIIINPNLLHIYYKLGLAYKDCGEIDNAIQSFKVILKSNNLFPNVYYTLGNTYKAKGEIELAIENYKTAISLKSDHADAHWNLSLTLLLAGDYENGWKEYKWRWKLVDATKAQAKPLSPLWNGKELNQLEKLLIVSEQGIGDTFQFIRYAIYLKNKGIQISICAQPNLHGIIKTSGIDLNPLSPKEANQEKKIPWTPLLNLPQYLKVNKFNPLINQSYLSTNINLIQKWGVILSREKKPIIGIHWQGNPNIEKTRLKGRSLNIKYFQQISNSNKIKLLSLQKDFGSDQLEKCNFQNKFVNCQEKINETWDFLETAAIIMNCQLIITSDSCIAHLSGALGMKTWLLLSNRPDWRWGIRGEQSFWYPSMRIFRQKEEGSWKEVMNEVKNELKKLNYQ